MKQKLVTLALVLGGFCFALSLFVPMTLAPKIGAEFGALTADWMTNLYSLSVLIACPIFTLAFIKLDYKKMLVVSIFFCALFNAVTGFVDNGTILCISRFIIGIFHGSFIAAAGFLATDIYGKERKGFAMSLPIIGIALAPVLGVPVLNIIATQFEWQDSLLIVSGLAVISLILIIFSAPSVLPDSSISVKKELSALTSPLFWVISAIVFCVFGTFYSVYANISGVLGKWYGFDDGQITISLVIIGVGMYIGTQIGGFIADKPPKIPLLIVVIGLVIVFALSFPLEHYADPMIAIALITSAFAQGSVPTLQVQLVEAVPKSSLITIVLSQGIICAAAFAANFAVQLVNIEPLYFTDYLVGSAFSVFSIVFIILFLRIYKAKKQA